MQNNSVYREIYKGKLICIEMDDCQEESPREWEPLGTMMCWHRRYELGDKNPYNDSEECMISLLSDTVGIENHSKYGRWCDERENDPEETWDLDVDTWLSEVSPSTLQELLNEYFVILPLYLYDHSGITMNTSGFSCPWDSGQVGFIYVSNQKAKEEYKTDDWRDRAIKCLRNEVETYDDYLTGNIYGYVIHNIPEDLEWDDEDDLDTDGLEFVDSCWGLYPDRTSRKPDYDYCLQEARSVVDFDVNKEQEKLWTAHQELHGLEE
jgi:hypothetical protein